ncbi:F-box DNA helicase 1 [Frankliniella fusca]|uniref:F-box DNA helicase 1 n=1 Tax=Frankliniella fusca TaxID=407009 RepID=A0AAE1I214_9NEOP|nr:F-box DNA helicase 1 [Frankliniella fusca]
MDVNDITYSPPGEKQAEKDAALQQAQGVLRLMDLSCADDPAWSLQLLHAAAPTVERLSVRGIGEPHLHAVHAMPRLHRLYLECPQDAMRTVPPELGPLPEGHDGLRWLRAWSLPRGTLQSLLRAHAATLEELEMWVGSPGKKEWPFSCSDLHYLLGQCGLQRLRKLLLWRGNCSHSKCKEQLAALSQALPGTEIMCDKCHGVIYMESA